MIDPKAVNRLLNVTTIEELWDLHTRQMADYGFDRLIYGCTRFRTETSLGDPDDFVILSNHEPDYIDTFIGQGLYFHAPMVRWSLDNDGACSWSMLNDRLAAGDITDQERKVLEFNQAHCVTAGYSISFKSLRPRMKAAMALTARRGATQAEVDQLWSEVGDGSRAQQPGASVHPVPALRIAQTRADLAAARGAGLGRRWQDRAGYRAADGPHTRNG